MNTDQIRELIKNNPLLKVVALILLIPVYLIVLPVIWIFMLMEDKKTEKDY